MAGRQDSNSGIQSPQLPSKLTRLMQFLRIKNWTVAANGACMLVRLGRPVGLSGILPRWPCCHCGASVVTEPDTVATERISKMSQRKIAHKPKPTVARGAKKSKRSAKPAKPTNVGSDSERRGTKQEAVIGLLSQPKGATIAAIMKATGWQKHSVRGFFASIVRKKLGLPLTSEKVDGARIYRVLAATVAGSKSKSNKSAPLAA
jgi:hypothetical protein